MLNLAFVWHMHQPFYRDLFSGEYVLPWVRLHGIKDYLDMARILDSFPRLHQNFNFSPVLLEQIQEYANGGMEKDYYWQLSLKPPEALSLAEREFVWKNFFMANLENLIKAHPRYYELYLKRQKDEPLSTQ